jgi:magnesium transporter
MAEDQTEREDLAEPDFSLDRDLSDAVVDAVEAGDEPKLALLLEPLHPADIADLLEQISTAQRRALVRLRPATVEGDVLSELEEGLRDEVIADLSADDLAEAVRELESDDVVDLVEDLEPEQQDAVLEALEDMERLAVEQALQHPEFSAGRMMQRELVMAPEHWNVGQTIDHLRSAEELPDQFYHVILVDPRTRPTGYVTLGRLLSAPRNMPLKNIAEESFRTLPVTLDEEDVAYAFNQYHLISVPVVDEDERLVGVITIDDAMAVLDEEAEEDMLRLAGVGDEAVTDTVWQTTKARLPWLSVNLVTAILASAVISLFDNAIATLVALAVLMPIVASMGGNAGTQTLTVAVRAIATRDLTGANAMRVLWREVAASLINGAIFAVVIGVLSYLWSGNYLLGYVIAAAMIINLGMAGFSGLVIPMALEKLGIDPALASGTFVTTVTDVVGFFSFLGLAVVFLL